MPRQTKNVLLALVTLLSILAASTADARPVATQKKITFVGAVIGDPFYRTMRCGALAAAKKYGLSFTWTGTTGADWAPELSIFNAEVQKRPDGIIVAPFSPTSFIRPVQDAMKSMPVVTVDGSLAKKVELQNIRTNNIVAGATAGTALGKILGGKGQVAIVAFSPDVPDQADRVKGFKQVIAQKYPGIKVVAVEYGGADTGKSARITGAILQRFPDLGGIYATDSNDAEGAGAAVLAAGKRGKVKLIGFDAGPKAVNGLKTGLYDGLVGQAPYLIGFEAVKTLANYLSGKNTKPTYLISTGAALITKQNYRNAALKPYVYRTSC